MNEIHLFGDFFFQFERFGSSGSSHAIQEFQNPGKSSDLSIKIKAQHQVQTLMFRNLSFFFVDEILILVYS